MNPLTTFLLARITEDEDAAKAVPAIQQWENPAEYGVRFSAHDSDHSYEDTLFLNRNSPARALAECEAKRRIVEEFAKHDQRNSLEEQAWRAWILILRTLAKVYADHADYDPAWDPS